MHNDSIETLLARHYGSTAVAPAGLEQRLHAAVRQQTAEVLREQAMASSTYTHPVSRRRAVQWVAMSSLGVSIVNMGLEALDATLTGSEATQNAAVR